MAAYFSNLPNTYVALEDSDERISYRLVKNIFRRVILEEKLSQYSTAFESYYVPDGLRPDLLAEQLYGDPELDWIILISNNIVDIYDEWPKDSNTLNEYIKDTYGNAEDVHHWETQKVLYQGQLFLNEGIEVNETFRVTLPNGDVLSKESSIYPVTNSEHEIYLNEKKRLIALPTSRLIEFFTSEFPRLVEYTQHDELDENGIKKTPISSAAKFIDRSSYRITAQRSSNVAGQEVTSFDYGPTSGSGNTSAVTTLNSASAEVAGITSGSTSTVTVTSPSSSSSSSNSGY